LPLNGANFRIFIISSFPIRAVVSRRTAVWMMFIFRKMLGLCVLMVLYITVLEAKNLIS